MSCLDGVLDYFFNMCDTLFKLGEKLKRLLEQRWTAHLATVSVINSLDSIIHLLSEIESTRT